MVTAFELELELIQTQMAKKPMLRAEVYARAFRASQYVKREILSVTVNLGDEELASEYETDNNQRLFEKYS